MPNRLLGLRLLLAIFLLAPTPLLAASLPFHFLALAGAAASYAQSYNEAEQHNDLVTRNREIEALFSKSQSIAQLNDLKKEHAANQELAKEHALASEKYYKTSLAFGFFELLFITHSLTSSDNRRAAWSPSPNLELQFQPFLNRMDLSWRF